MSFMKTFQNNSFLAALRDVFFKHDKECMIKTCSLLVFNIILQKAHKKAPKW